MAALKIELPPRKTRIEFNLKRWTEVRSDPAVNKLEGRIETDRHGCIIWGGFAPVRHGELQAEVGITLHRCADGGTGYIAAPICTADGIRITDVAWISGKRRKGAVIDDVFVRAPEICTEVLSPKNSSREINERIALYFDAGAAEVWLCANDGKMTFYVDRISCVMPSSRLCPAFPAEIKLR